MAQRVKPLDLPPQEKKEEKANPVMPADTRPEIPPGDPNTQPATRNETEMKAIKIATPTARKVFWAKAVFPFDLFPDEIILDEIKVSIVEHQFFGTENVHHILIKDIKSVEVNAVPFFAELIIEVQDGAYKIKFLSKSKAYLVKRILLGLFVMSERSVDTSKMEMPELISRAEELGKARN